MRNQCVNRLLAHGMEVLLQLNSSSCTVLNKGSRTKKGSEPRAGATHLHRSKEEKTTHSDGELHVNRA
ncbi:MAG: hypothetical protein M1113_05070 [Candidatus Thermoplasmatota archaeon]|nr:hypothetical protein [Candidatus Thermoplasmatota archaeon]